MKLLAGSRAISRIKTLREAHVQYLGNLPSLLPLSFTHFVFLNRSFFSVYDSHTFHFDTPKSFFNLYSRQGLQQPEFAEIAEKVTICTFFCESCYVRSFSVSFSLRRL